MSSNKKIDPQNFTLSLALVDALPVIVFSISCIYLYHFFPSILFLIGAICVALAGCGKVLWKIFVATTGKNIVLLNKQMRIVMPVGFALILLSLVIDHKLINPSAMLAALISFPSVIFFALFLVGMVMMGVLGKKMDSNDVKANWIEQLTNAAAQTCLLIGLLLIK